MVYCQVDERLSLKLPEPADAPQLFELIMQSKEYLCKWLPWVEMTRELHHTESYIGYLRSQFEAKRVCKLSICLEDQVIGEIGFGFINAANQSASLSYWVREQWQGQGIVTKCARTIIDYAFTELGLNRVEIHSAVDNQRAQDIAKRLGFVQEGLLRQGESRRDEYVDVVLYSMLKCEWKSGE